MNTQFNQLLRSGIAQEGIFEKIEQFFTRTKAPHPEEGDRHSWSRDFKEQIGKTYANGSWVEKSLQQPNRQNPAVSEALSLMGKHAPTPKALIEQVVRINTEWHRAHDVAYETYVKEIKRVNNLAQQLDAKGVRGSALMKKLKAELNNIKLPFPRGFQGREWLGGNAPVYVEDKNITVKKVGKTLSSPLPEINVKDVVEAAQLILKLAEQGLSNVYGHYHMAGAELEDGAWDRDENGYEESDLHTHVWDRLHQQSEGWGQWEMLTYYDFAVLETCSEVGKWLYQATTRQ